MTVRTEVESTITRFAKTKNIAVAYESVPFVKPSNAPYVAIVFLERYASNATVDAEGIRRRGLFQVECYVPFGKGMGQLEELTESIVSLFPVARKELFQAFSVEKPANISGTYVDGAFQCAVVRVEYRQEL